MRAELHILNLGRCGAASEHKCEESVNAAKRNMADP